MEIITTNFQELDDYYRRNYTSRRLLAASKPRQTNIPNKLGSNPSAAPKDIKSQDENLKQKFKEELREQDRREGRCYYCHKKGHLTSLCPKKPNNNGTIKSVEEIKVIDGNDGVNVLHQDFISSSLKSTESEN
ncbi:hypothetical protein K3495_g4937 [Podosphaera aphanis]|nr:hypothetical protein K3495_g4937 [Podosphaera aphanis]